MLKYAQNVSARIYKKLATVISTRERNWMTKNQGWERVLFFSVRNTVPHTTTVTSRAAIQKMWSGTGGLGTGDFASKNEPKFAISQEG